MDETISPRGPANISLPAQQPVAVNLPLCCHMSNHDSSGLTGVDGLLMDPGCLHGYRVMVPTGPGFGSPPAATESTFVSMVGLFAAHRHWRAIRVGTQTARIGPHESGDCLGRWSNRRPESDLCVPWRVPLTRRTGSVVRTRR